ncbi:DUF1934 domain-containing protein [Paenibacillus protaetiae]|uniref:DUF1934 domain-containing protein n=1 Tax=Paenibacillus protaetiae TaxID=2509456 RepID=A0A4V0YFD8_9BACL|nr:DUF1934 domain-containing protein [Paenibacillus protaetiae]QAY67361.1 DUF1934 domain-containing protein [Paenibacillus protaetiae]
MSDREQVRIKLISKADGAANVQTYTGEWFRKDKSVYIRYEEPAEAADSGAPVESVRSLIRYRPGELSLVRRGALQSEQLFVRGVRTRGFYRSPFTAFEMETATSRLAVTPSGKEELPSPPFTLDWKYKLWVGETLSGRFELRLHIEPLQEKDIQGGTELQ